jgi:hypothetical protein
MSASHPITDTAVPAIDDWRELATREGDGLEISRDGAARIRG